MQFQSKTFNKASEVVTGHGEHEGFIANEAQACEAFIINSGPEAFKNSCHGNIFFIIIKMVPIEITQFKKMTRSQSKIVAMATPEFLKNYNRPSFYQ